MMIFLAMLKDAYRQLNSKRLFWVILALSGVVVLGYGSIGFNDAGMSVFFGLIKVDNPMFARDSFGAVLLYRGIFAQFILGLWLAWIATILALVSTAGVFPDFLADGAIDIVLSKPISRVKLFIFKYLSSLLFVILQVSVFCVGIFLCLGIRLGDWEPRIFLAIPLLTVFFSYLYSITTLVGVWTRSAMAALLITMLVWFGIFSLNAAENILNMVKTQVTIQAEQSEKNIARLETGIADLEAAEETEDSDTAITRLQVQIESLQEERDEKHAAVGKIERWHKPIRIVQSILPKTGETIGLLDRWLRRDTDINLTDLLSGNVEMDESGQLKRTQANEEREAERRIQAEYESRSEFYVVGTSLAFEGVLLGLAGLIFARRDF